MAGKRYYDNWIKAYLQFTEYSEAPASFHFWTAVSTIGAALRKKVFMDQEHFQWTPNFYIIFVAPAGVVNKSTAISIGMRMLKDVTGVKIGSNVLTWQAMCQEMEQAAEAVNLDANGQKNDPLNLDAVYHPMSCVTYEASELGSLLDMHDKKMLDILTDLWDGKKDMLWKKTTKTQGQNSIPNPWINIIAGTTPKWIAENVPKVAVGGGFMSRCLFVYEDTKQRLIPYPKNSTPEDIRAMRPKLVHDLEQIALMAGEVIMTPEAIKVGEQWYIDHHKSHSNNFLGADFGGYVARKQAHIQKLAMVLAAAESNELIMQAHHFQEAVTMIDSIEKYMANIYTEVNSNPQQNIANKMLTIINNNPEGIAKTVLFRLLWREMTLKQFNDSIDAGINANLITLDQVGSVMKLRPIVQQGKLF